MHPISSHTDISNDYDVVVCGGPAGFIAAIASARNGAHPIDVHRAGTSNTDATFLQKPYGIPYRCLVPKDCSNLIVAGGSVSSTREAFASARVQAQCMAMGQAAGTAAALCVTEGLSPDALDGAKLREILRVQGAEVDENL